MTEETRKLVDEARAWSESDDIEATHYVHMLVARLAARIEALEGENASLLERVESIEWWEGVYDGKPLAKQDILNELHDLRHLASEVPKVYEHVTGGRISKPMTAASAVIAEHDDYVSRIVEDEIKDRALCQGQEPE